MIPFALRCIPKHLTFFFHLKLLNLFGKSSVHLVHCGAVVECVEQLQNVPNLLFYQAMYLKTMLCQPFFFICFSAPVIQCWLLKCGVIWAHSCKPFPCWHSCLGRSVCNLFIIKTLMVLFSLFISCTTLCRLSNTLKSGGG